MIFEYNKQINKNYWNSLLKHKEMFGMKFPDRISITEEDEKMAKQKVSEFSALWDRDDELREKISKIYKYNLPETLECYIVTTKTSAIYLEKKCILLSMYRENIHIPATIIHEFSHIAFLDKYRDICKELGYTKNGIQELKEVFTVINNLEFKDIEEKGYSVHQDIRKIVKKMWLETHNLEKIISDPKIISLVNSLNTIVKS